VPVALVNLVILVQLYEIVCFHLKSLSFWFLNCLSFIAFCWLLRGQLKIILRCSSESNCCQ